MREFESLDDLNGDGRVTRLEARTYQGRASGAAAAGRRPSSPGGRSPPTSPRPRASSPIARARQYVSEKTQEVTDLTGTAFATTLGGAVVALLVVVAVAAKAMAKMIGRTTQKQAAQPSRAAVLYHSLVESVRSAVETVNGKVPTINLPKLDVDVEAIKASATSMLRVARAHVTHVAKQAGPMFDQHVAKPTKHFVLQVAWPAARKATRDLIQSTAAYVRAAEKWYANLSPLERERLHLFAVSTLCATLAAVAFRLAVANRRLRRKAIEAEATIAALSPATSNTSRMTPMSASRRVGAPVPASSVNTATSSFGYRSAGGTDGEVSSDAVASTPEGYRRLAEHMQANFTKVSSVFHSLDKNGDGRVSKAELLKGLKHMLRQGLGSRRDTTGLDDATLQRMLKSADGNGDGMLDYYEFEAAVEKASRSLYRSKVARKLPMTTDGKGSSKKQGASGGGGARTLAGFGKGLFEALGGKSLGYA